MVEEISNRNKEFLAQANLHVRVLSRWQDSAGEFAEISHWFVKRAEELRDAQQAAPKQILDALLTEAKEKLIKLPANKKG